MTGQEGRFVYVVKPDDTVEKRLVTLGPVVWKAPPRQPGVVPPGWVLVNPHPPPSPEGAPPVPARRPVQSIVAITAGLPLKTPQPTRTSTPGVLSATSWNVRLTSCAQRATAARIVF